MLSERWKIAEGAGVVVILNYNSQAGPCESSTVEELIRSHHGCFGRHDREALRVIDERGHGQAVLADVGRVDRLKDISVQSGAVVEEQKLSTLLHAWRVTLGSAPRWLQI